VKRAPFSKVLGGLRALQQPWLPADQKYPRLLSLDPALPGAKEGIYAVWHLGVRPQWLRVGATANLGASLSSLAKMPWIIGHDGNAGIFVAWAYPLKDQQVAIVRFLAETLKPAYQDHNFAPDVTFDPKIVPRPFPLPPGTRS
jgi:hypothetical protein